MPINPNQKPNWRPAYDIAPRHVPQLDTTPYVPQSAEAAIADLLQSGDPDVMTYHGNAAAMRSIAEDLARTLHPHLFEPLVPVIDLAEARADVPASFEHPVLEMA